MVPKTSCPTWTAALGQVERSAQNRQADAPGFPRETGLFTALLRWLVRDSGEDRIEVNSAGWSHLTAWSSVGSCLN